MERGGFQQLGDRLGGGLSLEAIQNQQDQPEVLRAVPRGAAGRAVLDKERGEGLEEVRVEKGFGQKADHGFPGRGIHIEGYRLQHQAAHLQGVFLYPL